MFWIVSQSQLWDFLSYGQYVIVSVASLMDNRSRFFVQAIIEIVRWRRLRSWIYLNNANVQSGTLIRMWRLPNRVLDGAMCPFLHHCLLSLLLFSIDHLFEVFRVGAHLDSIAAFLDRLEGHVSGLWVVVGRTAEHLSLKSSLGQTVSDLSDEFGHLYCSLLVVALLIQEFEHLSNEWLAHD